MEKKITKGSVSLLILAAASLACAASADAADAWTCTYPFINDRVQSDNAFVRFEIATPDLIQIKAPTNLVLPTPQGAHYRILQNNDYGLVATFSISGIEEGGMDRYVGALSKMAALMHWLAGAGN
jgi:hypothetical protein